MGPLDHRTKIYLQIVGLIVVVLSAIPKCAIDQSILLQHSIFGIGGRLPMLFFLALSIVQIAAIVSGNENRILVGNISKPYRKIQININPNSKIMMYFLWLSSFIF